MATAVPGKTGESAAATQTFGALTIDRRVLATPTRTIAIANISTVSVGTHVQHQPRILWLALAAACALVGYAAANGGGLAVTGNANLATIVFGIAAVIFLILALKPDDKTHYLLISSNDGILSRFTGPDRGVLEEVRRILTEKINRGDEAAIFNINFEKGVIENLNVGQAGSVHAPTNINGSGNTVATNGATAVSGSGHSVQTANGAHGRAGTGETNYTAVRSPGAQLGNGHRQNGTAHANTETHVDFATLLPVVVEMHRFYARQPGAEHLEKRLEELEMLMRSGASTPSQKSRIRDLTRDLSQILQAYPQVVQVFNDIRGMAGI